MDPDRTIQDPALLSDYDVQIIHCPNSNLEDWPAVSLPRSSACWESGINVALGTDGRRSNNDLDRSCGTAHGCLLAKGVSGQPTALDAHSALALATLAGAQAAGYRRADRSL